MFRGSTPVSYRRPDSPRVGGGVPAFPRVSDKTPSFSPRRRGCSEVASLIARGRKYSPRVGGGVPGLVQAKVEAQTFSPRRRGCFPGFSLFVLLDLFPASADAEAAFWAKGSCMENMDRMGYGVVCGCKVNGICGDRCFRCSSGSVFPAQAGVFPSPKPTTSH